MKVTYTLTTEDYLEHQLFAASNSPQIKKQRFKAKIAIPVLYILIGLFLSGMKKDFLPVIIFAGLSLLWFFLYPIRDRKRYKKYYTAHVNETFKARIGKQTETEIQDELIVTKTGDNESRIHMNEVEEVYELKNILLIKLKTGSLIFPKSGIENLEEFKNYLHEMALKLKIPFSVFAQWEWK